MRRIAVLVACASASAIVVAALATSGGGAHAEEAAAATASPSSSPAVASVAPATPPSAPAAPAPAATAANLPRFDAEVFGDKTSKSPTNAEWATAKELAATRRSARADKCHVWRVREWIRVSCPDLVTASMSMLGGTSNGVAFWIDPPREGEGGKLPAGGEVQFPVRKGDRRVIQFLSFGPGYEGPFTQLPALVVQELWLADASVPVLVLH